MKANPGELSQGHYGNTASVVFRAAIAINFIRFAFSFSSRFEGNVATIGLADQVFPYRLGGLRVDFVWLVISTFVIFPATFYFVDRSRSDRKAKIDVYLCVAWVIAFVVYVARCLLTGIIDFG